MTRYRITTADGRTWTVRADTMGEAVDRAVVALGITAREVVTVETVGG